MSNNLPELNDSEVDKIIESFVDIYQRAVDLTSATMKKINDQPNNRLIISEWKQYDLERGKYVKILRYMLSDLNLKSYVDIDTVDISHWILHVSSKSGKYRAVIHSDPVNGSKSSETETKYYLDIWSDGRITTAFDLNGLDLHGAIYTDYRLSSLAWSLQEDKVIYIAERKKPKTSPFYEQKSTDKFSNDLTKIGRGDQFVYEEDWGEILSSKCQPVVVCCDISKKSIAVMEGVPKDISPGQTICDPCGEGVVGVGFINTPRKLGLMWCTNKKNHIFHLSYAGEYSILSDKQFTVHSPKFSPDGKYLIWFQRPQSGPINATHSIMRYDWSTKQVTSVIDIVQHKLLTENKKEFFGIFTGCHADQSSVFRCWTSDSKYLLFTTDQKYHSSTYAVDIDNGKIWDIGCEDGSSTALLDVSEDDYALLNVSSFKNSPVLMSLHIPSFIENYTNEFLFSFLTKPFITTEEYIISNFASRSKDEKFGCGFGTYYGPRNDLPKSTPLIMYLHGGPHFAIVNIFTPKFLFFTKSGFGLLIVHFRGTSGIGQEFIESLPGNMGSLDVEDCYNTLQTALEIFPWLDPSSVLLFGGSTGGFLAAHLTAQYPNLMKGSVMRNPVTDIYLRCFSTDIPDWAAVELDFPYSGLADMATTPEFYNKMIDISPVRKIKNVKAPTLLLLGKNDVRVPSKIGLAYYHMLKELKVPTKVLMYEDGHQLTKVSTQMDCFINSIIWFKRCL